MTALTLRVARRVRGLRELAALPRAVAIAARAPAPPPSPRVYYGQERIPAVQDRDGARGGMVKVAYMQREFPNSVDRCNLLYLVSSQLRLGARLIAAAGRRRGIPLVWNQNGVAYPGWHGPGWERVNEPMSALLHAADHVFYQSEFCRLSADRFLGQTRGSSEILYNAVDTSVFTPAESPLPVRPLVLLLAGNQYQRYRLEAAIRTLALIDRSGIDARLLVTGRLSFARDHLAAEHAAVSLCEELGIREQVTFIGPYSQADAPDLFRRAHVLLHPKYNDPCPTVVIEAMACGVPVVYSASGGVPELVGRDAGIGIPAALDWERDLVPDPSDVADAALRLAQEHPAYADAARRRAVERFDLGPWLARHREVFEGLLARSSRA